MVMVATVLSVIVAAVGIQSPRVGEERADREQSETENRASANGGVWLHLT
jgi:hypothetical protein